MISRVKLLRGTTCLTAALALLSGPAFANPENGVVSAGSATISASGSTLNIYQQSQKAVIDWRGFNIDVGETTQFHQPSANSLTLNRVNSNSASHINGNLLANGNIIIVNQNGVVFGQNANVDVNGLVATTADIDNARFMNSDVMHFDKAGNPGATIINEGNITVKEAGLVGFVAPNVENHGVIEARMGRVHLASGDTATIDFYGDNLMEVAVGDNVGSQNIKNTGVIHADGGKVALTAAAGRNIVHSLIGVEGEMRAQSVSQRRGEIIIGARGSNKTSKQGKSRVEIKGTLDVSGKGAGEAGGKIAITADDVHLTPTARLDAAGMTGGGDIKIGGDYQGTGTTQTAKQTVIEQGAIINNDAIVQGNGGRTIVWADGNTWFEGNILARGGANSGDGGFAEVSGKDFLHYNGFADLRSFYGSFGTLLLDPTDITISSGGNSAGSFSGGVFTPSGATSVINTSTLQTQLNAASVTISTASAFGGNGDITIANGFTWSTNTSILTLNADRDIIFNAGISGPLNNNSKLTATAARDITFNANQSVKHYDITAGRNLTIASGVILTGGSTGFAFLKAAGGNISGTGLLNINGSLNLGNGTLTLVSGVDGSGNRNDLNFASPKFIFNNTNVAATSISGFRDITISQNLPATAAVSIVAERNLAIASGVTVSQGNGTAMTLSAAGGNIANTGVLTLNGSLNLGGGSGSAFMLTSGKDGSGNYGDLTFNSSNLTYQGSNISTVAITGFRDITLNQNMTSISQIGVTAQRNLTIGSGTTLKTGGSNLIVLRAAGADINATGILTLNGILDLATGNFTLLSGVDGSGNRADLTLNSSNMLMSGSSIASTNITGFRDVTLNRDILASSTLNIVAHRNLMVGNGVTIKSGSGNAFTLNAAGGVTTDTGLLTMNGILKVGSGTLTINSGVGEAGATSDLILTSTNFEYLSTHTGTFKIQGFRDITVNRDITGNASITFIATRNLTINSGVTLTTGVSSSLLLRAANADILGTGLLTMNGITNSGNGDFSLISGLGASGERASVTLNSSNTQFRSANVSGFSITGFHDITIDRNITTTAGLTSNAYHNVTIGTGVILTSGTGLGLRAANSDTAGTGLLTINGTLNVSTGSIVLTSGRDSNGNRSDFTFNNSTFQLQGATIGSLTANGFRDVTIDKNLPSTSAFSITADRNLTISNGVILTAGVGNTTTLQAAGGDVTRIGTLTLGGTLNVGTTSFTLTTGLNSDGSRNDITIDNSGKINLLGGSVSSLAIKGFRDINFNRSWLSTAAVTLSADRNVTLASGITIEAGSSIVLEAAGRDITRQGLLTLNNAILNQGSGGNAGLSLYSGLDGAGHRADLTLNASNYSMTGGSIPGLTIQGFRDVTIDTNLTSMGGASIIAQRNLTIGSNATITSLGSSTKTLNAAGGVNTNEGLLTLNGHLNFSSGSISIISGHNGSGAYTKDLTLNASNFTLTGVPGTVSINGFRDITLDTVMAPTGDMTVTAKRHLTMGSNSSITMATGTDLLLKSADANIANYGLLNLGGLISMNSGNLDLWTGYGDNNYRPDFSLSHSSPITWQLSGNNTGGMRLQGFRDINIQRNIDAVAYISFRAMRHLDVMNVKSGINNSLSLYAADGNINGVGLLRIHGTLSPSTTVSLTAARSPLNLITGTDEFGNRQDLTLSSANFTPQKILPLNIQGWRDIVLNTDIGMEVGSVLQASRDILFNGNFHNQTTAAGTGYISATAGRDIFIGAGKTLTSGSDITLIADRNFINNSGAGALQTGTGRWLIYSTNSSYDVTGGIPYNFRLFQCSYGECAIPLNGNGLIYSMEKPWDAESLRTIIPSSIFNPQTKLPVIQVMMAGGGNTVLSNGVKVEAGTLESARNKNPITGSSLSPVALDSPYQAELIIDPEIIQKYDLQEWSF